MFRIQKLMSRKLNATQFAPKNIFFFQNYPRHLDWPIYLTFLTIFVRNFKIRFDEALELVWKMFFKL